MIAGFHPDPSICRVGDDFYIATSSFEYSPGVPIWHSSNLTEWTLIGNALDRDDQFVPGHAGSSQGVYAPTLRHHDGLFWLITTDVSGGGGQLLVTTEDPSGPWSTPVLLPTLLGIDPDIAWSDDGACWVTYCSTRPGFAGIHQAQVDPRTGRALEQPRPVWSGTGLAFPEAPHLYRRGRWWYLIIAEGGTERGHAVSVARAPHPTGPFTPAPHNPIFTRRSTSHPVQNTGHADLVERADGTWAAVYLGVRPRGHTPMFHVNGRETFVAGVDWPNEWPEIDTDRFSVPHHSRSFVDDFTSEHPHPRWVSPGRRIDRFTSPAAGGIALRPDTAGNGVASLIATRVQDQHWRVEAVVEGPAGLRLRLDERHWCEIRIEDGWVSAWMRVGDLESELGSPVAATRSDLMLVLSSVTATYAGPDDIRMAVRVDDNEHELARVDGRYISTEVAGGFTGRVIGVRALAYGAILRSFSYQSDDDQATAGSPATAVEALPASGA
ncbi:MAG: glycoside hydrolase family 43 protein [Microbacterium sp.]